MLAVRKSDPVIWVTNNVSKYYNVKIFCHDGDKVLYSVCV